MANITYRITLIDEGLDSGPNYEVFTSVNCVDYTFLQNINLEDVEDFVDVSIDDSINCIRLYNNNVVCTNFRTIVVGTAPTTTTTTSAPTTTTTAGPTTTTTTTTTTSTTTLAPQCDFDYELVENAQIDFLLVGGGGGGGLSDRAGGGGAVRLIFSSLLLPINTITTANIIIGNGGQLPEAFNPNNPRIAGENGQNTVMSILNTTYTAPGGGGGGIQQINAKNGGSGGGGGPSGRRGGSTILGTPIAGFGNNGGGTGTQEIFAASGGGAGATGGVTTNFTAGLTWFGDGVQYAFGGGGGTQSTGGQSPIFYGSGGGGNACCGNKIGRPGANGIVKIRYLGTPIATGGVITQKNGYTYHTFNSNGTFEFGNIATTTTTVGPPPSMDSDALQFILTANIINPSLRTAINNFVIALKDNNLWNKMNAIWPFVGDNTAILSTQFSINLKSPGLYNLTYPIGFGNDNNFAGFKNVANTNFNIAAVKGSGGATIRRYTNGNNHMSIFTNTLEPIKSFSTNNGKRTIDMGGYQAGTSNQVTRGNEISVGKPSPANNVNVNVNDTITFARTIGIVTNSPLINKYIPAIAGVGYAILSYNQTEVPHSGLYLNGVFLNNPELTRFGQPSIGVGAFNDPFGDGSINWDSTIAIGGSNSSTTGFSVFEESRSGKRFQMATIGDSLTFNEASILNSIVQNFQIVVGNIFDVNRTI
jgi:hypothetical protein